MEYKNKFSDGQKVRLKESGESVTIKEWNYVPSMKKYTYTLEEYAGTFFFEYELEI